MTWKNVNLEQWASEMGVDIHEINQKLQLRELIIKLRNRQKLTQDELAKNVGISRSRIAQIENGIRLHKMSFDVLLRIVQALGYNYSIATRKAA